jgi:transcriptional regulator with XRE-family HTH domain
MTATRSPRYRQFLTRLRAARMRAGLTQAQAAKALGKPQSYLSKCESGERRVDVVELERFAKLYAKPFSYFLP